MSAPWEEGNFGSYFKPKYGKSLPKEKRSSDGRYPVVGSAGVMARTDEVLSNGPTIVIGRKGNVGQVEFFEQGCYPIDTTYYIEVTDGWDLKFLELQLLSLDLKQLDSSTATPSLRREDLEAVSLVKPLLSEQRLIVEILEEQLSRLDAGVASLGELRRKAKLLRISMLEKLIVEEPQVTLNVPMLRIADFASVKGGKRLPKGTPWSDHPTGHPYIRATNIKHGSVATDDLVHVPLDVFPKIAKYIVNPGDVLITIAGTIGDVAVVPESLDGANLTENAAKISVDSALVNPDYLCYFLQAPSIKAEIEFLARATTQSKLALYRIETIVMPVPNLIVQESCLRQIRELEIAHRKIVAIAEQMHKRAVGLRRSLLHAAFTGQLTKESVHV